MHPVAVAEKLTRAGADAETIIAALLHDTVEDTPITLDEIEKEFGEVVTKLINGVTKLSAADIGTTPNLNEQVETLRKIFQLMQEDPRMMVIKLFDRLHNMETVEFLKPDKQQALAHETLDTYAKIADRLCMQDLRYELEELCYAVLDPELLERMKEIRDKNQSIGQHLVSTMRKTLINMHTDFGNNVTMELERKSWAKLRAQLNVEGAAISGLSPVTIAFICDDRDACYRVMGALHTPWKREVLSFQDFINSPELNGYQGLHTTIILEDGTRVRCKIRTHEMHKYAHDGITSYCFDAQKKGELERVVPWTKRIQSLTEDTTHRSDAFWQSLQSDILGASITIHGPDDKTVDLPKGATVLDGAFYILGEKALRATAFRVNGMEADPQTPLERSNAVSVELAKESQVTRDWLRWTQTSFAAATIRAALRELPISERAETGRVVLQQFLSQRKKGFIEEFEDAFLLEAATSLGFATVEEMLAGIADEIVSPSLVFEKIFHSRKKAVVNPGTVVLNFSFPTGNKDLHGRINRILELYNNLVQDVRISRGTESGSGSVRLISTELEEAEVIRELEKAGAYNMHITQEIRGTFLLVAVLIILWGLDPVMAKLLISDGVSPIDLTSIRFLTFAAAGVCTYAIFGLRTRNLLKSIRPLKASLLGSGVTLFLTALSSYIALQSITAMEYILLIIGGLVVVRFFQAYTTHSEGVRSSLWSLVLLLGAYMLLTLYYSTSLVGTLAGAVSGLSFALYSLLSKRFQEEEARIHARYPAYLFWLSMSTLPLTLLLLPQSGLALIPWEVILKGVAFSVVFVMLPYGLYFECMRRLKQSALDRMLPFVWTSTLVGGLLLKQEHSFAMLVVTPLLLIFLWVYLVKQLRRAR